ncbi:MAG: hypothetical protein ACI8TQ_003251 [Planctomycetota bacterium]|jgi:hypothetical protein
MKQSFHPHSTPWLYIVIALLFCWLLAANPVDTTSEKSTLVVEIEVDLPPNYSPSDFRFVKRRLRSAPE